MALICFMNYQLFGKPYQSLRPVLLTPRGEAFLAGSVSKTRLPFIFCFLTLTSYECLEKERNNPRVCNFTLTFSFFISCFSRLHL